MPNDGLDDAFDAASEGLHGVDELDLASAREDRLAAESQEDTAVVEEEGEEFEYEAPDGTVVKLNADQAKAVEAMMDAEDRATAVQAEKDQLEAELAELKSKSTEKPAETEQVGQIEPVAWDQVGDNFQSMLEEGRTAEIGPALNDVIHRTIFTSPAVADIISRYVDSLLELREQGKQTQTKFQEFVGSEVPETEVKAFMAANPWAKTRETAILGVQKARLDKQLNDLKAAKTTEVKEAEKKGKQVGAKETVQSLKAKGTLRRIGGTGRQTSQSSSVAENLRKQFNPKDENQRLQGAVALVQAMREGRT